MKNNNNAIKTKLCDIAEIKPGYPFRGSITEIEDSETYVVQVRDTHFSGEINSKKLINTELMGRKKPDWLIDGDILFVAKGSKNFASLVKNLPAKAVCSPHFFLVRIKQQYLNSVLPEFICWQLNQLPAQHYFKSTAEGSMQVSIRRQVLEEAPITLPSIEQQMLLINVHQTAVKEQKILQKLMKNRQAQLDAIALDILK